MRKVRAFWAKSSSGQGHEFFHIRLEWIGILLLAGTEVGRYISTIAGKRGPARKTKTKPCCRG
jgi:hypothetical protein